MRIIGIDIGAKNQYIGEWVNDIHGLNHDGYASCIQNDSGKNGSRVSCLFKDGEIFLDDHVGSKGLSTPEGTIHGCLNYFPLLSEEKITFESLLSPCSFGPCSECTSFVIKIKGETYKDLYVIVPTVLHLEYIFYRALKTADELYYNRFNVSKKAETGVKWVFSMPSSFARREIQMFEKCLEIANGKNVTLIRSSLAVLLEYGYYGNLQNAFAQPTPCLFIDCGEEECCVYVVVFEGNMATVEYLDLIEGVNGKAFTMKMVELLLGDDYTAVQANHKVFMRCMEAAVKAKHSICLEDVESTYVDMLDYIECINPDAEEVEVTYEQYAQKCASINAKFMEGLEKVSQFLAEMDPSIRSRLEVVPVGGTMRVKSLRSYALNLLKTATKKSNCSLTQTLNMDECVMMGTTLFGHLVEQNRLGLDEQARKEMILNNCGSYKGTEYIVHWNEKKDPYPCHNEEVPKKIFARSVELLDIFHQQEQVIYEVHARCADLEQKKILFESLATAEIQIDSPLHYPAVSEKEEVIKHFKKEVKEYLMGEKVRADIERPRRPQSPKKEWDPAALCDSNQLMRKRIERNAEFYYRHVIHGTEMRAAVFGEGNKELIQEINNVIYTTRRATLQKGYIAALYMEISDILDQYYKYIEEMRFYCDRYLYEIESALLKVCK